MEFTTLDLTSSFNIPAITFDTTIDDEYLFEAIDRITGKTIAAVSSYYYEVAEERMNYFLLENGFTLDIDDSQAWINN